LKGLARGLTELTSSETSRRLLFKVRQNQGTKHFPFNLTLSRDQVLEACTHAAGPATATAGPRPQPCVPYCQIRTSRRASPSQSSRAHVFRPKAESARESPDQPRQNLPSESKWMHGRVKALGSLLFANVAARVGMTPACMAARRNGPRCLGRYMWASYGPGLGGPTVDFRWRPLRVLLAAR